MQTTRETTKHVIDRLSYGEAFMLMKYRRESDGRIEWIWNSRDGITHMCVGTPGAEGYEGKDRLFSHVDWSEDVRIPNFIPPIGSRVFIDADGYDEENDGPFNLRTATVDEALQSRFRERAESSPYALAVARAS